MRYFFLILFITFSICLASCQSRMICPAFQSAFIYNDEKRETLFAYFGEDSLPLLQGHTNKSKYGIIEDKNKRKRKENFRTVEMKKVFPEKDVKNDSLLLVLNTPQNGEGGDLDSLVNTPPEQMYNYNVEQANYNRLFGKYIYKPPPPEPDETEDTLDQLDQTTEVQEVAPEDMSRKERRKARKEAKAKEKEEPSEEQGSGNISID